MKLFVDECLSSELVHRAIERGHDGSSSVVYRGLEGTKDWDLVPIVVAGDFTLVTKNSIDFRGRRDRPGEKGLYKDLELHAGLICLNGPKGMDLDMQLELFEVALCISRFLLFAGGSSPRLNTVEDGQDGGSTGARHARRGTPCRRSGAGSRAAATRSERQAGWSRWTAGLGRSGKRGDGPLAWAETQGTGMWILPVR